MTCSFTVSSYFSRKFSLVILIALLICTHWIYCIQMCLLHFNSRHFLIPLIYVPQVFQSIVPRFSLFLLSHDLTTIKIPLNSSHSPLPPRTPVSLNVPFLHFSSTLMFSFSLFSNYYNTSPLK